MTAEVPFDEQAYIRQRFLEQTKDLPRVQRLKARIGFALAPIWGKIKNTDFFTKLSKQTEKPRPTIDSLSPDAPSTRAGTNMGTLTGRR